MLNLGIDDRGVATVTLDRPEARNALNTELVGKLRETFESLSADPTVRVVVVAGNGKAFCAGADLNYMKAMAGYSLEENIEDAGRLGALFHSLRASSKPSIAKVHGAAFAGGIGLLAAADIAVAADDTVFSISEVKLGLVPANIMPYLIESMGPRALRRYAVTGERFGAAEALRLGLIHRSVPAEGLNTAVEQVVGELLDAGPAAVAECRRLIDYLAEFPPQEKRAHIAERLAVLRAGDEAQQRLAAFFERRR